MAGSLRASLILTGFLATVTAGAYWASPASATTASWAASTFALPATAANPETDVAQVTCPAASTCVAVGGYQLAGGRTGGFIAWDASGHWTAYEAALPPGARTPTGTTLSRVACVSASRCVAAGSYVTASGQSEAYLLSGAGRSWASVPSPVPAGLVPGKVPTVISALACPPAGPCVAAGSYGASALPMVVTGYGRSWAATPLRAPAGSSLEAVYCPAVKLCSAVGQYSAASGDTYGLVAREHTPSWSVSVLAFPLRLNVPNFDKVVVGFRALQCTSATSCVATAYYRTAGKGAHVSGALLYTSEHHNWRAEEAPVPPGPSQAAYPAMDIPGLACSAKTCVAVVSYTGNYGGLQDVPVTYLLREGASGNWAPSAPVTLPAGATSPAILDLGAVACQRSGFCVSVGTFRPTPGSTASAFLSGSLGEPASDWQAAPAPVLHPGAKPHPEDDLTTVACSSASCVALGYDVAGANSAEEPLVETLSG